jgi:hypothetical protein
MEITIDQAKRDPLIGDEIIGPLLCVSGSRKNNTQKLATVEKALIAHLYSIIYPKNVSISKYSVRR